MKKILIVDDEFEMRQLLRLYLQQENYFLDEAENGMEAYRKIEQNDFDLMILDVMMPIMDGWQTIEQVRKISDLPIIFLTAKGSIQDKVSGFSAGADDYLVKPFEEEELMMRVQALLRRNQKHPQENEHVMKYKGIVLDQTARNAVVNGTRLSLTHTEFDLLAAFLEHRGKALSRAQLVDQIWGIDFSGEDRTVDSHIKNLREKLSAAGTDKALIQTVWGIGYKLE